MLTLFVSTLLAAGPLYEPEPGTAEPVPTVEADAPSSPREGDIDLHLVYRPRLENTVRGNISGRPAEGNYRVTHRARVIGQAQWRTLRMKLSVQDVRTWGEELETRTDFDADGFDMHEAWGQVGDGDLFLRVGRQEVIVDEHRLVSRNNWAQQGRSMNAAYMEWQFLENVGVRALATRVPDTGKHDFFMLGPRAEVHGVKISVPLLFQTNTMVASGERGVRPEDWNRFTGGALIRGEGDFDWKLEGYGQVSETERAYFLGMHAGWKGWSAFKPTLWLDFFSGDKGGTLGTNEAFELPFPARHIYYGLADQFVDIRNDARNGGLVDLALKMDSPLPLGKLHGEIHYFAFPDESTDGVEGSVGWEVDLVYSLRVHEVLLVEVGAALFWNTDAFSQGQRNLHDWTYVQMTFSI